MKALLIIDVQKDYFPGGKCELTGAWEALEKIKILLEHFRKADLPIIYVQHINNRPEASFFLPNTEGVRIHEDIAPREGEEVVIKNAPNSFYHTRLWELLLLKGIDELAVCGMMTHMCIDTTVRAARDYELPVTLFYDACATKDLQIGGRILPSSMVHDAYMAGLSGMFAQVMLTGELCL